MSTKKIVIAVIVSGGFLFSCQKAKIQPNENRSVLSEETVVTRQGVSADTDEESSVTVIPIYRGDREIIRITDPNNDEDRNKRKKGK